MFPWIIATNRALTQRKPPVFCVHYATLSVDLERAPIAAVAVRVLGLSQTKLFSQAIMAEREGVTSIPQQQKSLEQATLNEFLCYVDRMRAKYPEAYWVHWAMRDMAFGWPHLEHRLQLLLGKTFALDEERLIDLHAHLALEYGREFVPRPQLLHLAQLNEVNMQHALAGTEEIAAWRAGKHDLVGRSTAKKAEAVGHLLTRYVYGQLVLGDLKRQRRRKQWPICAEPTVQRELLSAMQAARVCGVSRATWYRKLAAGETPLPMKLGGRSLWDARELRLWIDAQCPVWGLWRSERAKLGLQGFSDHRTI
jgi:predicted DNA-binding transcriptional regulator AlpA